MDPGLKAALYSGFIFPGCGYFSIGYQRRGQIAVLVAIACFTVIFIDIYNKANQIIEQLLASGQLSIDFVQMQQMLDQMPATFAPKLLSLCYGVLVLVWAVSVIDGYRLGRKIG